MTRIEPKVDLKKVVDRRDSAGIMAKFAVTTATVATCVLTITMVLGTVGETSAPGGRDAGSAARAVAGDAPYFPAQYKLDAPDEVPKQIETF